MDSLFSISLYNNSLTFLSCKQNCTAFPTQAEVNTDLNKNHSERKDINRRGVLLLEQHLRGHVLMRATYRHPATQPHCKWSTLTHNVIEEATSQSKIIRTIFTTTVTFKCNNIASQGVLRESDLEVDDGSAMALAIPKSDNFTFQFLSSKKFCKQFAI